MNAASPSCLAFVRFHHCMSSCLGNRRLMRHDASITSLDASRMQPASHGHPFCRCESRQSGLLPKLPLGLDQHEWALC
jgi:hypothetical protein